MTVSIRESTSLDLDSILQAHEQAFGETEGPVVSQLARNILHDPTAAPLLSLVAEAGGEIIGNIIFSPVKIDGAPEDTVAYILAPLAVIQKYQRKGVGKSLIETGLMMLQQRGAELIFVYGDPNYYSRSGFEAAGIDKFSPPYKLNYPPEAWMVLELNPGALKKSAGMVKCCSSLSSKEYW